MVHFVGAGSGAPELLTIRGMRLLQQADVVVYTGSLINAEILKYCREDAQLHNSAYLDLGEVLDILQAAEHEGKMSVRLHTGDPSLYGAIREQLDALRDRAIEWDITPGVSSMSAAAAALGVEYTLPGVSQSVIVSRIEGRTAVPQGEKLSSLAQHGCTMVLFLSAGETERVREELLKGAYTEDTPCAIVYKASWEEEKIVHCDLGSLHDKARAAGIERTALIIVGPVLAGAYELSKLYDKDFSTGYREAKG